MVRLRPRVPPLRNPAGPGGPSRTVLSFESGDDGSHRGLLQPVRRTGQRPLSVCAEEVHGLSVQPLSGVPLTQIAIAAMIGVDAVTAMASHSVATPVAARGPGSEADGAGGGVSPWCW